MKVTRNLNCQAKTNKAASVVALVVTCLLTFPSLSLAQLRWQYCLLVGPSSYPLRWGEREPPSDDMVAMPPGLDTSRTIPTSPGCYKVGTSGFVLSYKVEDSTLRGAIDVVVWDEVTGEVLWSKTYSRVPKEGSISLEGLILPSYITMLGFQVSWSGSGSMFTRFNVFVVLDAPKAPMDPAWVNVLRISCKWARGESTNDGAARKLTTELHKRGLYAGVTFARPLSTDPDVGERFYLREYIRSGFMGQCNDFADFLVCLMTSVGISSKVAQRTHPLLPSRREATLPNNNPGRLIEFCTKPLDIAPTGSNPSGGPLDGPQLYSFHQFCLNENMKVWDGMIAFLPEGWKTGDPIENQTFVLGMSREPDYRNRLVEHYIFLDLKTGYREVVNDPAFFWVPTPSGGFIPEVTAASLP